MENNNENKQNVNVNEQNAQVENNEKLVNKVAKMATNKYTLIIGGTLVAGIAIWKWGIPAAKKVFCKKQKELPTDSEGFENK